jgi:hypothetical protein
MKLGKAYERVPLWTSPINMTLLWNIFASGQSNRHKLLQACNVWYIGLTYELDVGKIILFYIFWSKSVIRYFMHSFHFYSEQLNSCDCSVIRIPCLLSFSFIEKLRRHPARYDSETMWLCQTQKISLIGIEMYIYFLFMF